VPGRLGHLVQPGRTVVCAASAGADGDAGISSAVLSRQESDKRSSTCSQRETFKGALIQKSCS
jgi:hypothetical protein